MITAPEGKPPAVSTDDDVEFLNEQIEALKRLGQRDSVSGGMIYDFSIRWGTVLAGRLPRLVHYSAAGQLDESAERNFQALCAELRGLNELISRFGLIQPTLTDTSTETAKRSRKSGVTRARRWMQRRG